MSSPTFDLQSHSLHSDGELPPAAVVANAAAAGVKLLALSDHDSVDGVAEALVAADEYGITLVTATEISITDNAGPDLHMCGYGIDITNEPLLALLQRSRGDREARAMRMTDKLEALGWKVDHAMLQARLKAGKTVGRPHIAQAVVAHPDNQERLVADGLDEPTAFLVAYLIEGKPGFSDREGPTAEETIRLIHGAGGVAVWAHPFWDIPEERDVEATLERFVGFGLDGVEAFYATYTREQTEFLVALCRKLGLITTGSSDYHGPDHRQFTGFLEFDTYGLEVNLGPIAD
jgi:3',5'-nucleoside bisphosphate phosphatase